MNFSPTKLAAGASDSLERRGAVPRVGPPFLPLELSAPLGFHCDIPGENLPGKNLVDPGWVPL